MPPTSVTSRSRRRRVHFERAWLDPDSGKVFCLSSGPSKGRPSRFSAR
ncbi:hypothetical protein ACFQQB_08890 [Nonomuraea rubra]